MIQGNFGHNCDKCQGLCCIGTLRGGKLFASEDPIGKPCKHLQGNFKCAIHNTLTKKGFPGCVPYSCYGVGNRLTQLLWTGGIKDVRTPKDNKQSEIVRVILGIFDDIEGAMSCLKNMAEKGKDTAPFQAKIDSFFNEADVLIKKGGNTYILIPRTIELYGEIRKQKKHIAETDGTLLTLSRANQTKEVLAAIQWLTNYPQADIPQKQFEQYLETVSDTTGDMEQLRKFIFAAYQFAWSFFGKPLLWVGVSLGEVIHIADEASRIYAQYTDSEDGFHTKEVIAAIFQNAAVQNIKLFNQGPQISLSRSQSQLP